MAIKITFGGATIIKPGAFSQTTVNLLNGFPLSDRGIVGIVGEAVGGAPGSTDGVQTFTSTQIIDLVDKYVSGPIVDAARALLNPARDARVSNGAQTIRIYKTNNSVLYNSYINNQTTSPLAFYGLNAYNYGVVGSSINFYVSEGSEADDEGTLVSDTAITFPLTITNADTMVVVVNSTTYTLTLAGTAGGTFSQAQTIALLNGAVTLALTPTWTAAPGGVLVQPFVFAAVGTTKISCTINPAIITAYTQQFEYAEMTCTASSIRTLLNMTVASTISSTTLAVTPGGAGPVRGTRGSRIVTVNQNATTEVIDENENDVYLTIRYTGSGTPAYLSIVLSGGVKYLNTAVTGAPADNLNIKLADYTIQELVNYIDSLASYTCVTSYGNASVRNAAWLDRYSSAGLLDIKTLPLALKGAQLEIQDKINSQSQLIIATLTATDTVWGQVETIATTAKRYLATTSLTPAGISTNTDFQAGFDALLNYRCNTVIPCISQDASTDITDGLTGSGSTYTIASVIAMTDAHCRTASNVKNRSERNCYIGYKSTFALAQTKAKSVNSEFMTMCIQNVDFLGIDGSLATKQPYIAACMVAGIQSGTLVGEPATFKYINAYGISHTDYDAKQDIDTALDAGLCVIEEPDAGGYRVVLGNTTYGKDANFCFNRISVMEVAHYVAYNLRQQLELSTLEQAEQELLLRHKQLIVQYVRY